MSGPIALLGSGEFEPWSIEAERLVLSAADGDGSVAILPLASAPEGPTFVSWARMGLEHFASIDVPARVVESRTEGTRSTRTSSRGSSAAA